MTDSRLTGRLSDQRKSVSYIKCQQSLRPELINFTEVFLSNSVLEVALACQPLYPNGRHGWDKEIGSRHDHIVPIFNAVAMILLPNTAAYSPGLSVWVTRYPVNMGIVEPKTLESTNIKEDFGGTGHLHRDFSRCSLAGASVRCRGIVPRTHR